MKIGDRVKTNKVWDKNRRPITGKVTDVIPSRGIDMSIIEIDNGKYKINEFWLDNIN